MFKSFMHISNGNVPVQFLRANRAKAKFCEHLKIVKDRLISLLFPSGVALGTRLAQAIRVDFRPNVLRGLLSCT